MPGGDSKISRLASTTERVADVRFDPIRIGDTVKKAFPDMAQLERDVNDRLRSIQTAINDLVTAVKFKQ